MNKSTNAQNNKLTHIDSLAQTSCGPFYILQINNESNKTL